MLDDPGDEDDGGAGGDGRMQALVERIEAAYGGETNDRIICALIEELCEALLQAPPAQRLEGLERAVEMVEMIEEAEWCR